MANNTRSKRRATDPATSSTTTAQTPQATMKTTMPKTPNKVASRDKEKDLTQNFMQGESLKAPIISKPDLIVANVPAKAAIPFNIVEQMKRSSINVSMWHALGIHLRDTYFKKRERG